MNWSGGYVSNSTTKRNALWFVALAALLSLHACAWLQWQAAQDEAETAVAPPGRAPAADDR